MVAACVAITDCIASLPLLSSTATEMVLWWTSRPIYLMLSIGCSFREVGYCFAQQPYPTAKGAPFYNACPTQASFAWVGVLLVFLSILSLKGVTIVAQHPSTALRACDFFVRFLGDAGYK